MRICGSVVFVIALLSLALVPQEPAFARTDSALRQSSVREVLDMIRGGVSQDVMVERVRRFEDVPYLDPAALTVLANKGVPDQVLLELIQRRKVVTPCELPEREISVREILDHPCIREVLLQVDSGVTTDAILVRVAHLDHVPTLDARALSKLTSKGVPNRVLIALIQKQAVRNGCDPARLELLAALAEVNRVRPEARQKPPEASEVSNPAPRATTAPEDAPAPAKKHASRKEPSPARSYPFRPIDQGAREVTRNGADEAQAAKRAQDAAPAADSAGLGRIRVIAKSSLPVTYVEVLLDGTPVTSKGEVQEAEVKPGWKLPPPTVLDVRRGAVVFESVVPAGTHEIQTAFAVSWIIDTDWDEAAEARGQRYDTSKAGPASTSGKSPACEVHEGRTCTVYARLLKNGDGFAVEYQSKMR